MGTEIVFYGCSREEDQGVRVLHLFSKLNMKLDYEWERRQETLVRNEKALNINKGRKPVDP